jgi:hypothetical protein
VETVDLNELGEYIAKLSQAGAPLFPDEELENYLRRQAALPERIEEEGPEAEMPEAKPPKPEEEET